MIEITPTQFLQGLEEGDIDFLGQIITSTTNRVYGRTRKGQIHNPKGWIIVYFEVP